MQQRRRDEKQEEEGKNANKVCPKWSATLKAILIGLFTSPAAEAGSRSSAFPTSIRKYS